MIAKKAPSRKDGKSSFSALGNYITGSNNEEERLIYCHSTNCISDDMDIVMKEIEATQALNSRTASDSTYHLIASFREGERPSREQLDNIEQTLCDAIGLGDHQRIAAVHDNTDHLHIHMAINKVHPSTLRMVTPYRDFYHLQAACRELEQRYGLEVDRGNPEAERISTQAQDLEAHQGVESFQRWAKGEPLERLQAALDRPGATWASVHRALSEYGVELAPRAAGLVLRDLDGHRCCVKA